jgi:hypothetical protein
MNPQKELEQAIAAIDEIVSAIQCNRAIRQTVETAWQLIVTHARESQPEIPAKADGKPPSS